MASYSLENFVSTSFFLFILEKASPSLGFGCGWGLSNGGKAPSAHSIFSPQARELPVGSPRGVQEHPNPLCELQPPSDPCLGLLEDRSGSEQGLPGERSSSPSSGRLILMINVISVAVFQLLWELHTSAWSAKFTSLIALLFPHTGGWCAVKHTRNIYSLRFWALLKYSSS